MIYQNHHQQRIIFCRSPWIRLKSRITGDQAAFWVSVAAGVLSLLLPWGGQ